MAAPVYLAAVFTKSAGVPDQFAKIKRALEAISLRPDVSMVAQGTRTIQADYALADEIRCWL
jgi:hypothetical protein